MVLNSKLSWVVALWIALLALCLAGSTQAGTRMYTGSLIIKSFGNDTTTGTAAPYDTGYAVGIPLTGECNQDPLHLKETLTFYLPQATPSYTVSFTIPTYGGAIPTIDTNSDTIPDVVPGCGDLTVSVGNPLTGMGPAATTGNSASSRTSLDPRGFTVPKGALRKWNFGDASFNAYGVYLWEVHFADLFNDKGAFSAGGGDGSFNIGFNPNKEKRSVIQTAGKNKFGGVMRLLGSYGDSEGYFYNNATTSVFYFNWLFHYLGIGGQGTDGGGNVTDARHTTYVNYGYTRSSGYPTTSTVYASLFKWTTGTVKVTARGGTFPTVLERKGYDNRTAMGSGAVQLVSPMLTKWVGAGTSATGAIGVMKVQFAPEPSEWMMLASAISLLGLLAHWRRSRRP